jgi:hypothetical protein
MEQGYFASMSVDPVKPGDYIASMAGRHSKPVYLIDPARGTVHMIGGASFKAWSPGCTRFCTAPCESTSNYQLRRDGSWRAVWTDPLAVVDLRTNKEKFIQGGLLACSNADWQGGKYDDPAAF